jgi:membrane-bound metal-dependent hydrolase YbcI (DUF457 family)
MPNRLVHRTTGAGVGLAIGLHQAQGDTDKKRAAEVIASTVGGYLGAAAPDWIDPPTSPNHRSIGHSIVVAGGGIVYTSSHITQWRAELQTRSAAAFSTGRVGKGYLYLIASSLFVGFVAGYASHLVLDASTPKGLPLLK